MYGCGMPSDGVSSYPAKGGANRIQGAVGVGLNLVPIFGGALAQLLELVVRPSFDRRQQAWADALGATVADLEAHQVTPAMLSEDEEWISAVARATRAAIGTHVEEKLAMLKHLLTKMALDPSRDSLVVSRFIQFVDELEIEHFLVLKYLADPAAWFQDKSIEPPSLYSAARRAALDSAQLGIENAALNIVLADLGDSRLAEVGMLSGIVTQSSLFTPVATPLGVQLLQWVWAFAHSSDNP